MIDCQNLSLSFNDKQIFNHLNLHINKGERVCLGGESGKGKTTFLKLIQGYHLPNKGTISINGEMVNEKNIQHIRKGITWIPQNINLPVNNGLELTTLLNFNNQKLIEHFLVQLGLETNILSQDFQKISGGQKQRVIIAICLSLNKDLLLMDEPTSSLDEDAISLLIQTVKSLTGTTILSASHNQKWLQESDRVINL